MQIEIKELSAVAGREHVPALAEVLLDCVEGGASVSFMAGFTKAGAEAFFENVVDGVARGERILLAAFVDLKLVGTVQIVMAAPPSRIRRMSRRCWWPER